MGNAFVLEEPQLATTFVSIRKPIRCIAVVAASHVQRAIRASIRYARVSERLADKAASIR